MPKKLLIIGAKGMLGTDLMEEFKDYQPTGWDVSDIDITSQKQVEEKITTLIPEIIINAAAYTRVDDCEKPENRNICMNVNGHAVGYIAQTAKKIDATLIHFGTDYIFNGKETGGYNEDYDHIEPINVYGESKALGEQLLKEHADKYYMVRTSWLYGKQGKNFVDTMLKLASERDTLKVINDQHGRPTYTKDLAKQIRYLIEKNQPFGVYHITNEGECTWYEFAVEIFKQQGVTVTVIPCTTEEYPTPAKRPHYSMLNNNKLPPLRSWQQALEDYLQ